MLLRGVAGQVGLDVVAAEPVLDDRTGITGVMCSPWWRTTTFHAESHEGLRQPAERFRAPIERFAEEIMVICQ